MRGLYPNLEDAINELFEEEPFNAVDEQLYQWLLFSLTGKGRNIQNIDALHYAIFKEKLNYLLDAVYNWHTERLNLQNRKE